MCSNLKHCHSPTHPPWKLHPLLTSPALKKVKELTDQARSSSIDPNLLLIAKLFSQTSTASSQPAPQPQQFNRFETLSKQIGILKQGEDIDVYLHRFEFHPHEV